MYFKAVLLSNAKVQKSNEKRSKFLSMAGNIMHNLFNKLANYR